jgi:glycosyltransferase involved in cell wall biosynthesis
VDEVWCASAYIADNLRSVAGKPVRQHPLVVTARRERSPLTREDLGLPNDRYLFGFAFDYRSVFARKNPLAVVAAFERAFGPDDGAALVLKSINGDTHHEEAAMLTAAIGDRPDIIVIDRHLPATHMQAFTEHLDCFVSLHRSEGLGFGLLHAMAAGKAVVATGHSGNMTFMDDESALLVPFTLVDVGQGSAPYPPTAVWAEPDIDAASNMLRRLHDDRELGRELGRRARESVLRNTPRRAAEWIAERSGELMA